MSDLYLVSGADGFLGRHFLAELARRGVAARAMIQETAPAAELPGNPQVVRAELLKPQTLAAAVAGATHVIHLAARVHQMDESGPNVEQAYFEVNVDGTQRLMQATAAAGATHFLLMSTVKAMGEQETGEFDETSAAAPASPYGRSKLAAEKLLFASAPGLGLHATALRLPMVYGPGAKGNVLRLLEAARAGRRLPFGAVRNRRSMVYVDNVVDAALAALASPRSAQQVYLVCDKRPYGTAELYTAICKAMGKPPLLRNVPPWVLRLAGRAGDVAGAILRRKMPIDSEVVRRVAGDLCFRADKIRDQVGFVPAVELDEGIARTVEWYRTTQPA